VPDAEPGCQPGGQNLRWQETLKIQVPAQRGLSFPEIGMPPRRDFAGKIACQMC
jgi:hypothetical protein